LRDFATKGSAAPFGTAADEGGHEEVKGDAGQIMLPSEPCGITGGGTRPVRWIGTGRKSARWRRRPRRFRTDAASGPGAVNLAALYEWLKREHACDDSLKSVQRVAAGGTTTVLIDTLPDLNAQLLNGRVGRPERGAGHPRRCRSCATTSAICG